MDSLLFRSPAATEDHTVFDPLVFHPLTKNPPPLPLSLPSPPPLTKTEPISSSSSSLWVYHQRNRAELVCDVTSIGARMFCGQWADDKGPVSEIDDAAVIWDGDHSFIVQPHY